MYTNCLTKGQPMAFHSLCDYGIILEAVSVYSQVCFLLKKRVIYLQSDHEPGTNEVSKWFWLIDFTVIWIVFLWFSLFLLLWLTEHIFRFTFVDPQAVMLLKRTVTYKIPISTILTSRWWFCGCWRCWN